MTRAYFDELYARTPDPWSLATRSYEARKYAITLASLPRARYRRIFEPGCSVGVLTRLLAGRGDTVLATDISPAALATARRSGICGNVQLRQAAIPHEWPLGLFDLIVFSELGYYFDELDLDTFVRRAAASLEGVGHLVAVHWRQPVPEYPGDAANVHRRLAATGLEPLAHYEDDHFLLDVFGATAAARLAGPEAEGEAATL